MKCFYCGEEIQEGGGRIVPLDTPYYVNLWAHREICANAMDKEYLIKNIDRVAEYFNKTRGYSETKKTEYRK